MRCLIVLSFFIMGFHSPIEGQTSRPDVADPIRPRLGLAGDSDFYYGAIGNEQEITSYFSIAALANIRMIRFHSSGFKRLTDNDVITTDYWVLTTFHFPHSFDDSLNIRFQWAHLAAHLLDDGIDLGIQPDDDNIIIDFFRVVGWRKLHANIKSYAAFWYTVLVQPKELRHFIFQVGGEFDSYRRMYLAFDISVKSINNWQITQIYQTGYKISSKKLRFYIEYRTGYRSDYVFYKQSIPNPFRIGINILQ